MKRGNNHGKYLHQLFLTVAGFRQSGFLPHGVSFECDPVRVMDEAVEDGVREGVVPDALVPRLDGELARDDGGFSAVTVLE